MLSPIPHLNMNFFEELEFSNIGELKNFFATLDSSWCFRGQSNFDWRLQTTIDRITISIDELHSYKREFEKYLIRDFRRNPQFYSNQPYIASTDFQIISYMQHFGAPTRLLDFTASPYVATFFSLNGDSEFSSVYALNYMELMATTRTIFATQHDDNSEEVNAYKFAGNMTDQVFDKLVLGERQFTFVEFVQPFYMFERMIQQQGLFFCQGDLSQDFESNLYANYLTASSQGFHPMYKIKIPTEWKLELLRDLQRMNITYASLFPGVEGYLKSAQNTFDLSALDRLKHITNEYLKEEKRR